MTKKRKDFTDSQIHDALDAANYSIASASKLLGVSKETLYRWVINEENLHKYKSHQIQVHALKARERLEYILDNCDATDLTTMSHVIKTCQIFLDKAEATKTEVDNNIKQSLDQNSVDLVQQLLDALDEDIKNK